MKVAVPVEKTGVVSIATMNSASATNGANALKKCCSKKRNHFQ